MEAAALTELSPETAEVALPPGLDAPVSAEPPEAIPTAVKVDSLALGVTWLLALTVIQRTLGFGRNILVCRYLDPVELGKWNLLFQFFILASPLLVLGIPGTFGRYAEAYRLKGQLRDFLKRTLTVTGVSTVLGIAGMLAAYRGLAEWVFNDVREGPLTLLAVSLLAVIVLYNLSAQLLAAVRLPRALSIVHFVNSAVFTAVAIGILLWTNWGAAGVAVSYACGCLASTLVASWVLRRWWNESATQSVARTSRLWQKLVPLAIWIWSSDLLFNLFSVVDRTMIVHFSGESPSVALGLVGQYHSGYILGLLLISIAEMLASVWLPYLSHSWETGDRSAVSEGVGRGAVLVAYLLTGASALIVIGSPILFDTIMQGKYSAGRELLPMMLSFCVWYALSAQIRNYLWVCERGFWITVVVAVGIVANIGWNLMWLPKYGLSGAVAATAAANLLMLVATCLVAAWYGWRASKATWAALCLPALLCVSPILALLAASAGLVYEGVRRNWIRFPGNAFWNVGE